jgi:hypothetical protein
VNRSRWAADIEEVELNGPSGRIEGVTLRLYNPKAHQWTIYWANSKNGVLDSAPRVGQFKNGRGEFYGQDTFDGKLVYVRQSSARSRNSVIPGSVRCLSTPNASDSRVRGERSS